MGIRDFIECSQDDGTCKDDNASKELNFITGGFDVSDDEDGFSFNLRNIERIERLKSYMKRRVKK